MLIAYDNHCLDITSPENVEIEIRTDKRVVWININGICVARLCRIKKLKVIQQK